MMKSLQPLVHDYLKSGGFRILRQQKDCLIVDKLDFGGRDTRLVWTVPSGKRPANYEVDLLDDISSICPTYPEAQAFVLASSREGFSRDFFKELSTSGVKFRVAMQFFDAPFKVEDAPKSASVITDIRTQGAQKRVPQPFSLESENNLSQQDSEEDLFDRLRREMHSTNRATVRLIVGRAGIGKSYLFRALFNNLYGEFVSAKRQQQIFPRPIPLLAEHLNSGTPTSTPIIRTSSLIENFLRTDVATPIVRETFEWFLINGFATWLLDGLDELYAGDPDFFEYLFDLIAAPNSQAQITIWCRDSMLTTSDKFAEFQDVCADPDVDVGLEVYRLSEWQRKSKRQFAWLKTKGNLPKPGAKEPAEVSHFLQAVDSNEVIKSLSGLPFYCDIILSKSRDGDLQNVRDDIELLNNMIDQMVKREVDKVNLKMEYFEKDGLEDWMKQIAIDYIEDQRYSGIDKNQAKEYGEVVLRSDLDDQIKQDVLTSLLQFPFFISGKETGRVAFAHDLIADNLAARAYLRFLEDGRGFPNGLARIDLKDSMLLRFMSSRLGQTALSNLIEAIRSGSLEDNGFATALSLLLLSNPSKNVIEEEEIVLEGCNLSAVRFDGRNLTNVSFRRSDLSYTEFANCDLRGANFEGAFLCRTRFVKNRLESAEVGNLSRAQSLIIGSKFQDDLDRIRTWFADATKAPLYTGYPCPTALQIAHLFGKFISPTGRPRRDDLWRRGLLSGKRFAGAATVDACLDEVVRREYLTTPDERDRCRRTGGDKYNEMVAFVTKGNISDGIGRLIETLCPMGGCTHGL